MMSTGRSDGRKLASIILESFESSLDLKPRRGRASGLTQPRTRTGPAVLACTRRRHPRGEIPPRSRRPQADRARPLHRFGASPACYTIDPWTSPSWDLTRSNVDPGFKLGSRTSSCGPRCFSPPLSPYTSSLYTSLRLRGKISFLAYVHVLRTYILLCISNR